MLTIELMHRPKNYFFKHNETNLKSNIGIIIKMNLNSNIQNHTNINRNVSIDAVLRVSCMAFRVSCFASKHAPADYMVTTNGFFRFSVCSIRQVAVVGKV